MKKIKSLLIIIILFIWVSSGTIKFEGKENSSGDLITESKEQNIKELGETNKTEPVISSYSNKSIRFDYPSEWTTTENPTEDILYVDFCDANVGAEPIFKFSMSEAWLVDFDRTMEDYEMILSRSYSNVTIKELSKITINNNDAIKLIFTCTLKDKEYTIIQHEMINGYASFKFKYKVPSAMVDSTENKVDLIINSIEFIKSDSESEGVS